ncbi:MAG: glycosyltransferase family 9 protein [Chloroflexota bacterium]|jgi:ADP-heptose:LPS heptosyltransferase
MSEHEQSAPSTQDSALRTQDPKYVRRIAVVRPGQVGDILLAIPGIRALKKGFPGAEITLIGQRWAFDLPRRFRYIDTVLDYKGFYSSKTPSAKTAQPPPAGAEQEPQAAEQSSYDLVLQLQGDEPWAASLALDLKGRFTAGYCRDAQLGGAFSLRLEMRDDEPEVLRVIRLIEALGIPRDGTQLEFPILPTDIKELESVRGLAKLLGQRPLLVIHPGARAPAREWPAVRFAELARYAYHDLKATLLLTGGTAEKALVDTVREMSGVPTFNLAGRLSLGGLAALLHYADLFIGNDSGPAQLAAAVAPRSLRLFGPANPYRWAPLDRVNHRMIYHKVECNPCGYWECPIDHRCLARVTVEQVLEEAKSLLFSTPEADTQPQRFC